MIRSANHSSYPRIGDSPWDQELRHVARERERGLADDAAVRAVEDAVASMMVAEQSRAFVDVVTDGQVRWSGPFSHVASRLGGVRLGGLSRWFESGLYDRRPVVSGPILREAPILVRDAQQALDVQPKALKVVLPGPVSLAHASRDRHYGARVALARAYAEALAAEARDLAAAGVSVFQLDEPMLCRHPGDAPLVAETASVVFEAAGPRATTIVPAGATIIDARGKFLMPGLVDTNVHLSLYGGTLMADESYATRRGRPAGRATIGAGPGRGSAW